jgi:hemerythrin-like domain-containing protein
MHAALDRLYLDHDNAARVLTWMGAEFDRLRAGNEADFQLIGDAMAYVLDYAELFHHPNEDVMFDRLEARDASLAELLVELAREHVELAEQGAELRRVVSGAGRTSELDVDMVSNLGQAYTVSFHRHMEVEEGSVLPLMDQIFDSADWQAIARRLVHMDDPLFGRRMSSRFKALRTRLQQG